MLFVVVEVVIGVFCGCSFFSMFLVDFISLVFWWISVW